MARAAGLRLKSLAESGGYPLYHVDTGGSDEPGLYASAGIHGDEPASCEGLLRWAERNLAVRSRGRAALPMLLFPCLNPWGLVNNRRTDAAGNDLNRLFDRKDLSPIAEIIALIKGRRFGLALHLHEDYDAQGTYIYEVCKSPVGWSRELLAKCQPILPVDGRPRIDRRVFERGVYFRHGTLRPLPIHPEAIHLYRHHCPRVFTFETPSEFDLGRRVRAQVLLIEESVKRLLKQRRGTRS